MNPNIFVSYSWNDKEIVNIIDKDFQSFGINLIRDERDLIYKQSVKEFMRKAGKVEYVLMIISDSFLKSQNCMFEVMELLNSYDFKSRIMPILVGKMYIFSGKGRSDYLKYWEEKIENLEIDLNSQKSISHSKSIIEDLDSYKNIRSSIDDFLYYLKDHLHYSFKEIKELNYYPIKNFLGINLKSTEIDSNRGLYLFIKGQEQERSRLAKELYNSLGVSLTLSSLRFNFVKRGIHKLTTDEQQKFNEGYSFLNEAINESRNISYNLMPQTLTDFGYSLAIESLLEDILLNTSIDFSFYDNLNNQRLSIDLELILYRITQELINNILKHSEATIVNMQLIKH